VAGRGLRAAPAPGLLVIHDSDAGRRASAGSSNVPLKKIPIEGEIGRPARDTDAVDIRLSRLCERVVKVGREQLEAGEKMERRLIALEEEVRELRSVVSDLMGAVKLAVKRPLGPAEAST